MSKLGSIKRGPPDVELFQPVHPVLTTLASTVQQ